MGFLSCTFQRNLFQNTYNFIRIALIALAYDEKKLNYMYLGTPLNVKYKRSGCSLPKTTKFCTQVTENYIFITETAVLYQTTLHRDMQYLTGRHSVQINFVYLSAGVSRGLCKFWWCDMAWSRYNHWFKYTYHQTLSWLSMLLGL